MNFSYDCLDFLDGRTHSLVKIPFKNYIHFHFDEKWSHIQYIKKYTNIEPLISNTSPTKHKKIYYDDYEYRDAIDLVDIMD